MKKFVLTAGIVLATATGAFAQSSILDVYKPEPVNHPAIDYTATAAIGSGHTAMVNPRLGDGAPPATVGHGALDHAATAAIHGAGYRMELGPRLGDGAPL
ncbi:MAG: hypothetical protein Kow0026_10130 [Oricola sp.]